MNLSQMTVPLSDCISLYGGGTPSKDNPEYWNGTIPWASVKDLKAAKLNDTQDSISELGLNNSSSKMVKAGSIIIATRMAVGRVAIAGVDVAINQDLKAINCSENVDVKYLFYFLFSQEQNFNNVASGATVKGIKINHILDMKIPLPPLTEQKKIAEILDVADSLRQKDQQLIEHYTALSQSLFLEMFGDPFTNQHGFEIGTIRDLLETAKYGTSAKAQEAGEYPYLRMNNITYGGDMDFTSLKYISLEEKDKPKYLVRKGDILFNRTNSRELVGKTGLYNENKEMVIAGYLIRLRTNAKANPYFIWAYLNSKHGKIVLNHMCKSIVGMANINAQELQNIKIVLPPVASQNKFAERIKAIEKQKQQVKVSLKKSEALFNSLLQRAFKGELTESKAA
ncbi:MAG: restriction endonuclease subunit S [Methylococcales bacterium]|nr:restriction endonuclease subunit S [Methylococcales bacterium]